MITLNNLKVTFSPGTVTEKFALKGVNMSIKEGEFITVIGSNGAGKSTLLNAISGELLAQEGKILMDDEDVTRAPSYARSHLVARVFQDPLAGTCGDLTIEENLALAERRGKSRRWVPAITRQSRSYYQDCLKRLGLGLENRLSTPMSLLSGGQRQAVSLLMATLSPMKILLLDEHTSALDPKTAEFIMNLTTEIIAEKKLTALMVTHSLHQALHQGNRTVMLHDGRIIFEAIDPERQSLTVKDLLDKFGTSIDDDRLLLQ